MQYRRLFWLLLALLLTACLAPAAPTPTATSQETSRITAITSPTNTPAPTSTFSPTSTSTRAPTRTPTATKTLIPTRTPTPTFAPLAMRLPHALYFLNEGSIETEYGARPKQIWRLDPDGVTLTEITHEIDGVAEFDVSLAIGYLAYVINHYVGDQHGGSLLVGNQLVIEHINGTGRRIVVNQSSADGKSMTPADFPRWSPDGHTLAYHRDGLVFYQASTKQSIKVIADNASEYESYYPDLWSPDGKLLLVKRGGYEGGWWMLYNLGERTLIKLEGPDAHGVATWSPDNRSIVYTSSYLMGDGCVDMLQFDVLSQTRAAMVPCQFSEDGYTNYGWPLFTSAGDLLYLHNEADNNGIYYTGPQPPWSIMRSRWNDATSPAVVRSGIPVNISEVLWADDGDLAIAGFRDGPVVLIPADKSQPIQFIVADGTNLRWGP